MADLELTLCTDDVEWDRFVADSPQGSIFASSAFLAALGEECVRLLVREDGQPILAAPVLLRDGIPLSLPYPFTQYLGPMFGAAIEGQPLHRRAPLRLRLLEFLLTQMAARWSQISFSLHPALQDVRAFQWFNFHTPEQGHFVIRPGYTGRLDLAGLASLEEYLGQIRTVRRQEFRKVERLGYQVEECADYTVLDRLHELTFNRQELARAENEVRLLRAITTAALAHGFGHCFAARSPGGDVASALLFIHDRGTAYYLFGANDPQLRKQGTGTWLLIHAIEHARAAGRRTIDFVGVNSPNRGDFKISFNAEVIPYFIVAWRKIPHL